MLDDDDGVARVDQAVEDGEELLHVREVQPGGGLVEDVEGAPGIAPRELGGELDPLRLAAGELGGGLAQPDVAEPDILQGAEAADDAGLVGKELGGIVDGHLQDVGDRLAAELHLQRLAGVATSLADVAGDVDVGQEVHLDLDHPVARAGLAPPAGDVEGEATRLVAADLGLGQLGEEVADVGEDAHVGGRVAARGPADRRLVDVDDLVDVLDALDLLVLAGALLGPVEGLSKAAVEDVVDERRLATAAHPGDADEEAEGELHGQRLEIVLGGTGDGESPAVGGAAQRRDGDAELAAEVLAGDAAF